MKPGGETQDAINSELSKVGRRSGSQMAVLPKDLKKDLKEGGRYPGAGIPQRCQSVYSQRMKAEQRLDEFNAGDKKDKILGAKLRGELVRLLKEFHDCKWQN